MKSMLFRLKGLGIALWGCFVFAQSGVAQQDPQYTQYMFNLQAVNPAYVGSQANTLSATLLARRQWFSIPGAPVTQSFSVNGSLMNGSLGIGAVILNDKIGISNATSALFNWAYHLKITETGKLGFGMYAGIRQYRANFADLKTSVGNNYDPAFDNTVSKGLPVVGVGAMYHTDKFYLGLSIPQLITSRYSVDATTVKHFSHFFLNTGYVMDAGTAIKIRPSIMVKYVNGAPISIDLNTNVWFKERFGVGASYRVRDSFDLLFEFQASKNLSLGYAFDLTLTKLGAVTNPRGGSHELMLRYQMGVGKGGRDKIVTPRLF